MISKKQAWLVIMLFFVFSMLIRIPHLNRPVSKHHEFNTAVILINIISWRQAGGGSVFHFTPLMNFQHPGDKSKESGPQIDKQGNQMYLSFGPGWYVISYFLYQLFHLPVKPIYLRLINLTLNLAAVILLFLLFEKIIPVENPARYTLVALGCFFWMFTPSCLWYFGNGYITTNVQMPFVVACILLTLPLVYQNEKAKPLRLFLITVFVVISIYIEWFILFFNFFLLAFLVWKSRREKIDLPLFITLALSSLLGIAIVFFQFASYAGAKQVIHYWALRFTERSVNTEHASFANTLGWLLLHFITSYLPLLILLGARWIRLKRKRISFSFSPLELLFLKIYGISLLVYNLVFFDWSFSHEFSIIPWAPLIAYVTAKIAFAAFNPKQLSIALTLFLAATIAQYYVINPPGKISRVGMAYAGYQQFGEQLRVVPPDYTIFSDLEYCPMIEYYAGRNISGATSYEEAKQLMRQWKLTKAVWIEHDGFHFKKIMIIQ